MPASVSGNADGIAHGYEVVVPVVGVAVVAAAAEPVIELVTGAGFAATATTTGPAPAVTPSETPRAAEPALVPAGCERK